MTIFQKIAASSFAAVQRTLRRPLIALTIQESLMHDQKLDIDQRMLTIDSDPIELTRTEFNLLEAFLSNPGYTLTRDELLEKSLGYAYEGMGRALDTHIRNLRRKIEPDPDNPTYIQTMYGVGYRLTGDKK